MNEEMLSRTSGLAKMGGGGPVANRPSYATVKLT